MADSYVCSYIFRGKIGDAILEVRPGAAAVTETPVAE